MKVSKNFILATCMGVVGIAAIAATIVKPINNVIRVRSTAERTITINSGNRILGFYANGVQNCSHALFPFQQGSYGLIYASQGQEDVILHEDDCILALWKDVDECKFRISPNDLDGQIISRDQAQADRYTVVKFNQLNKIDITLDKGDGTDRILELSCSIGGKFTKTEDVSSHVKYQWGPSSRLGSGRLIEFSPEGEVSGHKAIWLTELKFYYDC